MVVPSSFSPDSKGYKAYLLALGISPSDQAAILANAIPFAAFKAIDRETLQDKIDHAGQMCEQLYAVYQEAKELGNTADMEMSDARWTYFSRRFTELVRQKNA